MKFGDIIKLAIASLVGILIGMSSGIHLDATFDIDLEKDTET